MDSEDPDTRFFDVYVVPWEHFEWGLKSGASVAFVAVAAAFVCMLPIYKIARENNEAGQVLGALFVVAIFGGLVGYHGGNSRVGVVGDLIPAVLTLVAGFAAYLFGVPDKKPGPYMIPLLGSFIVTVFITWGMGASNSGANDDIKAYVERCFAIYTSALEADDGISALDTKLGDYCDYAFDISETQR
ncbi:hypothetical protein [Hoeflea poritis]|uniref:Uncharacterized protein n=1 Tax=Hoeflea poritis TaxID=2993659 RepID=A0ABT4VMY3_9HYPH|nr:hypothetical protein [Hoeflea poritis]MDA4846078.1 hypothetical protein [Hoeflea poritis]